jgi:hypothetical protein
MDAPSTKGRITEVRGDAVVFQPTGTVYELLLQLSDASKYDGPIDTPISGVVRLSARKVYSVHSGGNFIEPIFGRPRIVQGRVRHIAETGRNLIVQAGIAISVDLPEASSAIDLPSGAIRVGHLVNVTVLPGASIQLLNHKAPNPPAVQSAR